MFDIKILESPDWRLSIGAGGFGLAKVVNKRGEEVFATKLEKYFVQKLIQYTTHLPSTGTRELIFSDFCCALFENSTKNSQMYHMFFGNGPQPTVDFYVRGGRYSNFS